MSTELKTVVESLLTGFVAARTEADKVSVSVAREYQACDIRRNLSIPMVDIDSVSVDLRFAFDEGKTEPIEGVSERQAQATAQAAEALFQTVKQLESVNESYKNGTQRNVFVRKIKNAAVESSNASLTLPPKAREMKIESAVERLVEKDIVNLSRADFGKLKAALSEFQAKIDEVPVETKSKPGILVGAEALSGLSEDVISTMRIDVKLKQGHWEQFEDESGAVTSEFVMDEGGSNGC